MKILWLAGNLNHYKARFLNHLAKDPRIELTILSGTGREGMGDLDLDGDWGFEQRTVSVPKNKFGTSSEVRKIVRKMFDQFDWVLIPVEKKNLVLFLYLLWLRSHYKNVKLISYNHPVLKSGNGRTTPLDKILTRFYYGNLDRVVFYTEDACKWAVDNKFIQKEKALWANNTIDTSEIDNHYSFVFPPSDNITILFIGRLIPSKRVDILLEYFSELQAKLVNLPLKLEIIGDGPDRTLVEEASGSNSDIIWHGAIVDERIIMPVMKRCNYVFVPGHSGLSINHAFAYGRPYITKASKDHAPEISYLLHMKNGIMLKGNTGDDIEEIGALLRDKDLNKELCKNALETGEKLSVENWVHQMIASFEAT